MQRPGPWRQGELAVLLFAAACGSPGSLDPSELGPTTKLGPTATGEEQPQLVLHSRIVPFDPVESDLALAALRTSVEERLHLFVRFKTELELNDFRDLDQAGVRLLRYVDFEVYVASIPTGLAAPPAAVADRAMWFGRLLPIDKLHHSLADREVSPWAVDPGTGHFRVHAAFFQDVPDAEVTARLATLGISQARRFGANNGYAFVLPPLQLDALLELDMLEFVHEEPPPPRPLNDEARVVTHTTDTLHGLDLSVSPPALNGRTGEGIRIGISDWGIDASHEDFVGTTSRFYVETDLPPIGEHGTHVASIAAGDGSAKAADLSLRGHAPGAMLADYKILGGDETLFHDPIAVHETDVTNHSYGQSPAYDEVNAGSCDLMIRGDAGFAGRPQVWAAGNNGATEQEWTGTSYFSIQCNAKNAICVGSVDSKDELVSRTSSRGPTLDGRIKPDLVAPGYFDGLLSQSQGGIEAAEKGTSTSYIRKGGTSMAAPAVTGILALVMEEIAAGGIAPKSVLPSTYKALLIHTAKDLVQTTWPTARFYPEPDTSSTWTMRAPRYHAGPDFATGWGLVDAAAAVALAQQTGHRLQGTISSNVFHDWCVEVPVGAQQIKVVLAWDDLDKHFLETAWTGKLVNDLDLLLIDPSGNPHRPFVLEPPTENPKGDPRIDMNEIVAAATSATATGPDTRNNVEMVLVDAVPGTWTLRVDGSKLKLPTTQQYSLVASEDIMACGLGPFATVIDSRFGDWSIDPNALIDIAAASRFANLGPCKHSWKECYRLRIVMELFPPPGVPFGPTRTLVIDDAGTVLAQSDSEDGRHVLEVPESLPSRRLFATITDAHGEPLMHTVQARLHVEELRTPLNDSEGESDETREGP